MEGMFVLLGIANDRILTHLRKGDHPLAPGVLTDSLS